VTLYDNVWGCKQDGNTKSREIWGSELDKCYTFDSVSLLFSFLETSGLHESESAQMNFSSICINPTGYSHSFNTNPTIRICPACLVTSTNKVASQKDRTVEDLISYRSPFKWDKTPNAIFTSV
jgi:hypothetical protein